MRCLRLLLLLSLALSPLLAQSLDEEEAVQVQGAGSGDGPNDSDDEDLQGSGLPAEQNYETTPVVHPKMVHTVERTSTEGVEERTTTVVVRQRLPTSSPVPDMPRITTRHNESSAGVDTMWLLMLLAVIVLAILVVIAAVVCCRNISRKKQAYRPGSRETPDSLLNKSDY